MAATIETERTTTELLAWTLLDDNAATPYQISTQLDISSEVSCLLNISMAACNTNAIATAGEWVAYGKSGSTQDDWHEFARGSYGTTANGKTDFSNGLTLGEVSAAVGDTTHCEIGSKVFLYDTSTIANSMINTLADFAAGDQWIFCFSATKDFSTHVDAMCPSTGDGCHQWPVRVPDEYWAARVVFLNDDADVNYAVRVQYNFITDYTSV